jgi:hypothetical protein
MVLQELWRRHNLPRLKSWRFTSNGTRSVNQQRSPTTRPLRLAHDSPTTLRCLRNTLQSIATVARSDHAKRHQSCSIVACDSEQCRAVNRPAVAIPRQQVTQPPNRLWLQARRKAEKTRLRPGESERPKYGIALNMPPMHLLDMANGVHHEGQGGAAASSECARRSLTPTVLCVVVFHHDSTGHACCCYHSALTFTLFVAVRTHFSLDQRNRAIARATHAVGSGGRH